MPSISPAETSQNHWLDSWLKAIGCGLDYMLK